MRSQRLVSPAGSPGATLSRWFTGIRRVSLSFWCHLMSLPSRLCTRGATQNNPLIFPWCVLAGWRFEHRGVGEYCGGGGGGGEGGGGAERRNQTAEIFMQGNKVKDLMEERKQHRQKKQTLNRFKYHFKKTTITLTAFYCHHLNTSHWGKYSLYRINAHLHYLHYHVQYKKAVVASSGRTQPRLLGQNVVGLFFGFFCFVAVWPPHRTW